MISRESHYHGKEKVSWIEKAVCQVFNLRDSEGIIHFHAGDMIWYTPPDGNLDMKKIRKFMDIVHLERVGSVTVNGIEGLSFRILDVKKSGLASKKL